MLHLGDIERFSFNHYKCDMRCGLLKMKEPAFAGPFIAPLSLRLLGAFKVTLLDRVAVVRAVRAAIAILIRRLIGVRVVAVAVRRLIGVRVVAVSRSVSITRLVIAAVIIAARVSSRRADRSTRC